MLVITVREGDIVTIGDHVKIRISRAKAHGLKMAIDCPTQMQIQVVEAVEPEDNRQTAERVPAIVTTRRTSR